MSSKQLFDLIKENKFRAQRVILLLTAKTFNKKSTQFVSVGNGNFFCSKSFKSWICINSWGKVWLILMTLNVTSSELQRTGQANRKMVSFGRMIIIEYYNEKKNMIYFKWQNRKKHFQRVLKIQWTPFMI